MNFYILISRRYQTWHVPSAFLSFPEVVPKDNTDSMSGFFDVRCVRISAFSME